MGLVLALPTGCGDDGTAPIDTPQAVSVSINPDTVTLPIGESHQVTVLALDSAGSVILGAPFVFAIADSTIARVNSSGRVSGTGPGTTTLVAVSGEASASVPVQVFYIAQDDFDVASLDRYELHESSAGVESGWRVQNGMLRVVGELDQALAIRQDVAFFDGWVETDVNYADDGGLVLRFLDNDNYLLLAVRDDATPEIPDRNIEIYQRRQGMFYSIATYGGVNIDWPRGVSRRIRFEARGEILRAFVNGVEVESAVLPAPHRPGNIGLRHKGWAPDWEARYEVFRWRSYPP